MAETTMMATVDGSPEMMAQDTDLSATSKGADETLSQQKQRIEHKALPNARPPKAPKPSSSKPHLLPLPQKTAGSKKPRSSSLPRAMLPQDGALSSNTTKRARRSESVPRPSQSHFLQGINVNDCFDVRSIPDPPSPVTQRNRRRLSTPILMVSTSGAAAGRRLEDVTNQGNKSNSNNRALSKKAAKASSNKKRKSLCHVPSSSSRTAGEDRKMKASVSRPDAERSVEQKADAPPRFPEERTSVCLEDEELEYSKAHRKRRKKRQSIVVPAQLPLQDEHSSSSPTLDPPSPARNFPGTKQSMDELRALVRGYCALQDEHRESSAEANSIKEMTGYTMPGSVTATKIIEGKLESSSKDILANRRSVFLKISPAMMEMEKRKQLDIKQWEDDTGCRVEKSTKSGKYKYYTIENRQRVGSQEYKRRYMAVLEGTRPMRETKAQLWMDMLRESYADMEPALPSEQSANIDAGLSTEETTLAIDHNALEAQEAAERERQQREAFLPPMSSLDRGENFGSQEVGDGDDAMDICDLSVSLDHGDQATLSFSTAAKSDRMSELESASAEIVEVSSEDTAETDIRRTSSSPSPLPLDVDQSMMECDAKEQGAVGPVLVAQSRDEGTDESSGEAEFSAKVTEASGEVPLLPLPSRDSESLDPNIAQAERNLWSKIDNALKEYSEEVMMIMKAKESGTRETTEATLGLS